MRQQLVVLRTSRKLTMHGHLISRNLGNYYTFLTKCQDRWLTYRTRLYRQMTLTK
jgi:hypothetical protein